MRSISIAEPLHRAVLEHARLRLVAAHVSIFRLREHAGRVGLDRIQVHLAAEVEHAVRPREGLVERLSTSTQQRRAVRGRCRVGRGRVAREAQAPEAFLIGRREAPACVKRPVRVDGASMA